jgi:hypothetical protein
LLAVLRSQEDVSMMDVVFVLATISFFAAAWTYARVTEQV